MNQTFASRSPVLLIIFNRPDTTNRVFSAIRQARPPRLYVAADGPRSSHNGEAILCLESRRVTSLVDWPCEVKTLFREKNLGCKEAVSSAIDWFFSHEEEGTILEDDCIPSPEFFGFCDTLLDHYRHDTRVRHIGGANLQHGQKRGHASYYFSRLTHVWGWATWKRVWNNYDKTLSRFTADEIKNALEHSFAEPHLRETWLHIALELKAGKIDTWDFQLAISNFFEHGLSIIPCVNLVTNIGFDSRATHTLSTADRHANLPVGVLGDIVHPRHFIPDRLADEYTLNSESEKEKKHREMIAASLRRESWWRRKWNKVSPAAPTG